MIKFDKVLVVTHLVYRKAPPFEPLEGPYSSVTESLIGLGLDVETCQIPLNGFIDSIVYGNWKNKKLLKIPSPLGRVLWVKYFLDILITFLFLIKFNLENLHRKRLIVGIDPLSCLPLIFLKKLLNYKLVFYSVDFNRHRFKNSRLQGLYEKADELSSRFSDQVWVVCESLKNYKKTRYQIDSIYIPNSPVFSADLYEKTKNLKAGNKMAWTGSFLTERQYDILFSLLKQIQEKARADLKFYFAPMQHHEKFEEFSQRYGLKVFKVLHLTSRRQWQEFAAGCDVGIATYDDQFGSTEFIEPLKIWDFMLCGMPFIISSEPSLSTPVKQSGVAYLLAPQNQIVDSNSLKEFLKAENLKKLQGKCLELAKEFDIRVQIKRALKWDKD